MKLIIILLFLSTAIQGEMRKIDIFPKIPNIVDYGSNKLCLEENSIYKANLKNYTMWAHKMLESSSKRAFGVLGGNSYQLGNHKECLQVDGPFTTQYCLLTLTINVPISNQTENLDDPYRSIFTKFQKPRHNRIQKNDNLRIGLCFPASCTARDIETSLTRSLKIAELPFREIGVTYTIQSEDSMCANNSALPSFGKAGIIFCAFSAILVLLIIFGTMTEHMGPKSFKRYPNFTQTCRLLSVKQTLKNFFQSHENDEHTRIFNGIRSISLLLIITGHKGGFTVHAPWLNGDDLNKLADSKFTYLFEQLDLLVSNFFVIAALLLSYGILNKAKQDNMNPFVTIFLRYIRLTPLNAFVTFYIMTVHYFTGSGPIWNLLVKPQVEDCQNNGWTNIFFVNNFLPRSENICNPVTWFVSCDFQFFVVGTFTMHIILKNRKIGHVLLSLLFVGFVLIPFVITIVYKIQPRLGIEHSDEFTKYLTLLYTKSYNHASCYIIGLLGGILYYRMKEEKIRVSKKLSYLILTVSVILMVMSSGYLVLFYHGYENFMYEFALYNALHRLIWSIGILGIFVVASFGTATSLRSVLSAPFWIPFAKLSYGVYMVHVMVITFRIASTATVIQPTIINMGTSVITDIIISLFIAFFLYIFVEMPLLRIFKRFFWSKSNSNKRKEFKNNKKETEDMETNSSKQNLSH